MRFATSLALTLLITGCGAPNAEAAEKLAERLADEGSVLPAEVYHVCGRDALSVVPHEQLMKAIDAPDISAVWAILGDEALNRYVRTCRKAEQDYLDDKS